MLVQGSLRSSATAIVVGFPAPGLAVPQPNIMEPLCSNWIRGSSFNALTNRPRSGCVGSLRSKTLVVKLHNEFGGMSLIASFEGIEETQVYAFALKSTDFQMAEHSITGRARPKGGSEQCIQPKSPHQKKRESQKNDSP